MPLTFLLGGARSGKSALAVRLASEWEGPVLVLATAEARDDAEFAAQSVRQSTTTNAPAGARSSSPTRSSGSSTVCQAAGRSRR